MTIGSRDFLKRITYRREVIAAARSLGLRSILRKWYYWWARPRDGIVRVRLAGTSGQFYVRSPEELRLLESAGGAGGEQRVLELLVSSLRPGAVVFDIGANIGLYTVLLAKVVGEGGRVIAFEPESQTFAHLLDNLKLNSLTNVRCFRKALGQRSGQASFYSSEIIGGGSLVPSQKGGGRREVVDIVEGDELVLAENLPLPQAVKIDVEGYEYAVIQGLRRTLAHHACEMVSCEIHPRRLPADVKPEMVVGLLRSAGFSRIDTYPRWDNTFHLVAYKEASSAG
jgi:FkbM family methyltransferase